MTDPRDFGRGMDADRWTAMDRRMGAPTPWGWIAGAVFVIVFLVLILGGTMSTRTALDDGSAPETTGMASKTAPPAIPVPPQPSKPAQSVQ